MGSLPIKKCRQSFICENLIGAQKIKPTSLPPLRLLVQPQSQKGSSSAQGPRRFPSHLGDSQVPESLRSHLIFSDLRSLPALCLTALFPPLRAPCVPSSRLGTCRSFFLDHVPCPSDSLPLPLPFFSVRTVLVMPGKMTTPPLRLLSASFYPFDLFCWLIVLLTWMKAVCGEWVMVPVVFP